MPARQMLTAAALVGALIGGGCGADVSAGARSEGSPESSAPGQTPAGQSEGRPGSGRPDGPRDRDAAQSRVSDADGATSVAARYLSAIEAHDWSTLCTLTAMTPEECMGYLPGEATTNHYWTDLDLGKRELCYAEAFPNARHRWAGVEWQVPDGQGTTLLQVTLVDLGRGWVVATTQQGGGPCGDPSPGLVTETYERYTLSQGDEGA